MSMIDMSRIGDPNRFYKQCTLQKGNTIQTSWIPEEFAKSGKYIRLKDDDGWKVIGVGFRASEQQVFGMQVRTLRPGKHKKAKR